MDKYAAPARENAKTAIQGYMGLALAKHADNRSRLFVPKIHSVVYSRMAMEAANNPSIIYKARSGSSEQMMKMLNAAKDNAEDGDGNMRPDSLNLWFHQNFDKILLGTGFRYLTYLYQERIVQIKDDNGKLVERKMVVYDDIWDEVPDFFRVGVSRDMQPGMFGGRACYYDKFYHKDYFMERYNNEKYKNVEIAAQSTDWYSEDGKFDWEIPQNYVRVRTYWNLPKDLMYVQANGVPIRKDIILDYGPKNRIKKFLPITSIHNDINYDMKESTITNILQDGRQYSDSRLPSTSKTFWTKGDAKLIQGLVGFSNSLWRAAHDHTKASSVHFLLARSSGVFDQMRTADLYGIVPLKTAGEGDFDVKSLTQGSNYLQQFQGMDEAIDSLMTYALGNDWKRASAELTNERATVAAIRQQVQRVRMAQNARFNETGGIKRHYRILLNLIQQYYPEKTMRELIGEVPEGTPEEDVVRDLDGHPVGIRREKDVDVGEMVMVVKDGDTFDVIGKKNPNFRADKASRLVPAKEEFIVTEEEPEIYIEPNSTFQELKAIDRAQNIEFLQVIAQFFSLQYEDGPLIGKEGAKYFLERMAESWDMDKDKLLGKEKNIEETLDVPMPFDQAFTQQSNAPVDMANARPAPVQTGGASLLAEQLSV